MKEPQRGSWYLLTGLILGLILGLFFAWRIQPVEYFDTSPAALRQQDRDQYRAMVALAYMSNRDIVRARARLELLEDDDLYKTLVEQAQRALAQDSLSDEARALGQLALDLGPSPQPLLIPSITPNTPEQGSPPKPTATNSQ